MAVVINTKNIDVTAKEFLVNQKSQEVSSEKNIEVFTKDAEKLAEQYSKNNPSLFNTKEIPDGYFSKLTSSNSVPQEQKRGIISSITDKIASVFKTNKTDKTKQASNQSKNLSTEEISSAIDFVKSHSNGFDFDSADFKNLSPNIQNYIKAHYQDAMKKNNTNQDISHQAADTISKVEATVGTQN